MKSIESPLLTQVTGFAIESVLTLVMASVRLPSTKSLLVEFDKALAMTSETPYLP